MELRDYIRILRKRSLLILTVALLCPGAALLASLATTPVYQGTARLLVVAKTDPAGGTASAYEGTLLSQQVVKSFANILSSRAIAQSALRLDPQPLSASQLQARIQAEAIVDTLLIELRVEDVSPARAKRLTNSVARAFILEVPRFQSGSALRVSLVEPALTPTAPIRPRTTINVLLGLILGIALGVGLAFLREFMDRSVSTLEELEAAVEAPVVGAIPPFKASKQPIPVAEQPRVAAAEAFRKLRTNFAFLGVDRDSFCCVVTSPSAAEGKSTVTANLAIALAQAGQRVVVIDADLRKPTLHKIFKLPQRVGTTTVLLDHANVNDALQHLGPGLPAVLTSGSLPPNPSELLGSRRMRQLLSELRAAYEVVLVDCAPLLPVADPMVVSKLADGLLLIARARVTTRDQAKAARAVCAKAGATVFGTVLNATVAAEGGESAYYSYYGEKVSTDVQVDSDDALQYNVEPQAKSIAGRAARHRSMHTSARQ
jgi:capsular exopolysaccharide synthesis family protein